MSTDEFNLQQMLVANLELSSERDRYRIEADRAMRDFDALELDAGIMLDALLAVSQPRPNVRFDPWATAIAAEAISKLSERTRGQR